MHTAHFWFTFPHALWRFLRLAGDRRAPFCIKHRLAASARVHVVFSTDCTAFQHWQALVLLQTAASAGQRGRATRIVSGCADHGGGGAARSRGGHHAGEVPGGEAAIEADHRALAPAYPFGFGLHFTRALDTMRDPWADPNATRTAGAYYSYYDDVNYDDY